MFLHESTDFPLLIETVSLERGILPVVIEKDYWVMHALWGLKELGFKFYLKGGTSLSKGYDLIERFSEDLDLMIEPPAGMEVFYGRNHSKPKHEASREEFFKWINSKLEIEGFNLE